MKSGAVSTDYRKMPDEELVHRYRHRLEHQALTPLFERYGHLVFGLCLSVMKQPETAANATHSIFIKLVDDLKKFDEPSFKPWLYTYVLKYCEASGYKNNAKPDDNVAVQFSQRIIINTAEQDAALEAAISRLNAEQRRCIESFYLNKMNYKEIAASSAISLQQVKVNLRTAKRYLKDQLERVRS